jgi:hypothetical protein
MLVTKERIKGRRGRVNTLNDLTRAGFPVPDGVVLTEEAHEVFLEASGILEYVKAAACREEDPRQKASEVRLRYGSVSMEAVLKREIQNAALREGVSTWPVLVQREISPLYTGWSTVERMPTETPRVGDYLDGKKVVPRDVEASGGEGPERRCITHLTLEATSVLGARYRVFWGFEGGMWYVLSTEMGEDEKPAQGWCS